MVFIIVTVALLHFLPWLVLYSLTILYTLATQLFTSHSLSHFHQFFYFTQRLHKQDFLWFQRKTRISLVDPGPDTIPEDSVVVFPVLGDFESE